ncbi:putative R3H and coiled-coil domain-containing protein 1 isoform 2 [Scophthalmus maximus]|uniref:Putative R3H and coiled-coil domain-containing protein 1 n=1 Tax=Scophthalmus maximus TaxID=52904 RepID=A0A2U9BGM3_SCOMX|nr:R3H and coiled-coil domain-containing protein 1 [Scophthalmus maximus]XP_035487024.1 R3H and coiled-coil domain-containing protein 1 [Scophthalmus maximus]AWP03163.1 putative R3H and coiled-coil domain-containing protein 1 [Scophthalmus maximus]AWP03164.1 putative R3H and coiled-coil domain-containing protein 1 isoform 2 [Scophthalmus maximus]
MDDLETYQQKSSRDSVLLFPCLPSRLRYLIHKTIEELPELTTFSVGESWCRRVAVLHSELRGEFEEDGDLESNNSLCEEAVRCREEMDGLAKPKPSIPSRSRGLKRPDKPLYMPRAARERLSLQNSEGPAMHEESPSPASRSCSCITSSPDSRSSNETTEDTKPSSTSRQESFPSVADAIPNHREDSSALCPLGEKQKMVLESHEAEPLVWEQTVSCFTDMTLEDDVKDKDDLTNVSCSAQIEDTSTDADDVTEEIKAHLKEAVSFSIELVHNDYSIYENVCVNQDEFRHVIEIYDFPPIFKTDDLLDAFTDYSDGGMKIKWVDNTHALGVFSNESEALQALSICHPLLKARALAEGSKKAKGKALRRAEFIQPVKERPRTDSAVAKRMVTRALGLQGRGRVPRY